eukprot:g38557.t1
MESRGSPLHSHDPRQSWAQYAWSSAPPSYYTTRPAPLPQNRTIFQQPPQKPYTLHRPPRPQTATAWQPHPRPERPSHVASIYPPAQGPAGAAEQLRSPYAPANDNPYLVRGRPPLPNLSAGLGRPERPPHVQSLLAQAERPVSTRAARASLPHQPVPGRLTPPSRPLARPPRPSSATTTVHYLPQPFAPRPPPPRASYPSSSTHQEAEMHRPVAPICGSSLLLSHASSARRPASSVSHKSPPRRPASSSSHSSPPRRPLPRSPVDKRKRKQHERALKKQQLLTAELLKTFPSELVLSRLDINLWRIVCEFVADNPFWMFTTWARLCKRANGPSARGWPRTRAFKLLVQDVSTIPAEAWKEWGKLSHLTISEYIDAEDIAPFLKRLLANNVQVEHLNMTSEAEDAMRMLPTIPGLHKLTIKRGVTDADLARLSALDLTHLDLSNSPSVTNSGLTHFAKYPNLTHLNLAYSSGFNGAGMSHLSTLRKLESLSLHFSRGVDDEGLKHLSCLTNLQQLDIGYCNQVGDAGLAHLAGLVKLKRLNLIFCAEISDVGLGHLARLENLQYLNLRACTAITDTGLAIISDWQHLEELDLQSCQRIGDAGLAHLSKLSKLQHLNLVSTQVTNGGMEHLAKLPKLRKLYLPKGISLDWRQRLRACC